MEYEGRWAPDDKLTGEEKKRHEAELIRLASNFTFSRIENYEDLNAATEKEGDEKFKEKTREFWKELVTHGLIMNGKDKQPTISNFSDLDGDASVGLIKLAGVDASKVDYVHQGGSAEGRVVIDTGNEWGLVVKDGGRTMLIDHHGPDAKSGTSASELTYKILTGLGLLKKEKYLDEMVKFVTNTDNAGYVGSLNKNFFENEFPNTLAGLRRHITFDNLREFFKPKTGKNKAGKAVTYFKDPWRALSEEELKELGNDKYSGKTISEISKQQKKNAEFSVKRLDWLDKNGFALDSGRYGKIIVDIGGKVGFGFEAAAACGYDTYIRWIPEKNMFGIYSTKEITDEFSQGIPVRGKMWISELAAGENLPDELLTEILDKMTDGKFKPSGGLMDFMGSGNIIDDMKGGAEKIDKLYNPEKELKNDFETPGEALERKEAKEFMDRTREEMKFSDSSKDYVNLFAKQQSEEINLNFAKKYFESNKDQLTQQGVDVNMSDSRKLAYFIKEGLGDEIKNKTCSWCEEEDYEKFLKKEELYNIRAEMEKGEMRLESPVVMLHFLEDRRQELFNTLNKKDSSGNFVLKGAERGIKEQEFNNLTKTQEELAIKTSGRNLGEESAKQVDKKIISKEKYTQLNLNYQEKKLSHRDFLKKEIWGGEWDKITEEDKVKKYGGDSDKFFQEKMREQLGSIDSIGGKKLKVKEDDVLILLKNGYDFKKFSLAGILGGKINTGKEVFSKKDIAGFLGNQYADFYKNLRERAIKELGEEWQSERGKEINLETYKTISKISDTIKNAEGGITGYLRRLKAERVNEILLKSVKTEQGNKEKIGKIEEFLGGKTEAEDFLKNISERKGIKNLGDELDDETLESIKEFMEGFGLETNFLDEAYENSAKGDAWSLGIMNNLNTGYKNSVNKRKGFINWMVGLVATLLNPPEKPKPQQQPGWKTRGKGKPPYNKQAAGAQTQPGQPKTP